ncbi:MAG: DUF58 domain-containing protein [Candidatus Hydrogenedentes bacterium]|nr:DUF58 domain-containing protein [Candidatus Hydrogenedentota bacterium]
MKPARGSLLPLVNYWWGFKTSAAGKVMAASVVVTASIAMVSLEIPAYQLMVALSIFVFAAFVMSWLLRSKLEARWRLPETAVAGQPFQVSCMLANHTNAWARDIGVGAFNLPPSLMPTEHAQVLEGIAPGKTAAAAFELLPLKRGSYPCPTLRVFSLFPFGLFRTSARTIRVKDETSHRLVVYPSFRRLNAIDVPVSARYQPGGIALSSLVGESPEYIGNREYRPGDSTRHLDHRSWARLAKPAVREYQEEYYCRVALVLDTFVPGKAAPGPKGFAQLEAAVSLAAAVADALARGEYILDLFAAGPELYVFRSGRHTAHFENVLEILACVNACRVSPFRKVTPALSEELSSISSVVFVLLDWDAERANLVRAAAEAGCSVKVVVVRDGAPALPYTSGELAGAIAHYSPETVQAGGLDVL